MNFRYVLKQLGLLVVALSLVLLVVAGWSGLQLLQGERSELAALEALLIASLAGVLTGGALWGLTRSAPQQLGRREALLLVALSWLFGAALAGLPYLVWAHLAGEVRVKPRRPSALPTCLNSPVR